MPHAHRATSRLGRTFARRVAVAIVVAMVAGFLTLAAAVARAAVSTNWAGYVSKGHGQSARFRRVVGHGHSRQRAARARSPTRRSGSA